MKYKKKILCFFLCIALMTGLFPVSAAYAAADWPTDVSISADGGIRALADMELDVVAALIAPCMLPAAEQAAQNQNL